MTDPRGISGAPEVARLLQSTQTPHVKAVITINGIEVGYSGSLSRLRHYLTVLEAQLDDRRREPLVHGSGLQGDGE